MSLQTSQPAAADLPACPYLGVREDPVTCLGYPAEWNLCYHARPVAAVSLEQQRRLCLAPVYGHCEVFQSARRAPLPKHLRGMRTGSPWKWALLAALLVLIALGLWVALQHRLAWAFPAVGSQERQATLVVEPSRSLAPAVPGACQVALFPLPAGNVACCTAMDMASPAQMVPLPVV